MKLLSKHFNCYAQKGWPWPSYRQHYNIYYTSCSCRLDGQQCWLLFSSSQLGCHQNDSDFVCVTTPIFPPNTLLIVKYFKPSHNFINTFSMVLSKTKHVTGQLGCNNTSIWWTILLVCGKCHFAQSMSKFLIYQLSEIRTSAAHTQC